jgi:hypothetical protein
MDSIMILGGTKQVMYDFDEYLRAYWVYVSMSLGLHPSHLQVYSRRCPISPAALVISKAPMMPR